MPSVMLTVDQLKEAVPAHLKTAITQDLVDKVNNLQTEPEAAQMIRDNMISYTHVLMEGKFKTEDYLSAVVYVSFKLMGYTNQEAYKRTFPARHQTLVARGADDKEISAYVSAYNKGKLVNMILEQTLVPTWVLNQDIYQKAINTQADLMMNGKSEKVRVEAANSILTHLKKPDKHVVELNLGAVEQSGMSELRDMMREMAMRQQALIEAGATTREIAHQKLIAAPVEDAEVVPAAAQAAVPVPAPAPAPAAQPKAKSSSGILTAFMPGKQP